MRLADFERLQELQDSALQHWEVVIARNPSAASHYRSKERPTSAFLAGPQLAPKQVESVTTYFQRATLVVDEDPAWIRLADVLIRQSNFQIELCLGVPPGMSLKTLAAIIARNYSKVDAENTPRPAFDTLRKSA